MKYRSMLAKAQLQSEAQNIIRAIQTAEPFLNLDPNSKDVIDCDGGVKFAAELYGLPRSPSGTRRRSRTSARRATRRTRRCFSSSSSSSRQNSLQRWRLRLRWLMRWGKVAPRSKEAR